MSSDNDKLPPRRSSDPVPGTKGPTRSSPPGGSAMPVERSQSTTAPREPASPKLLQRALDDRMKQAEKLANGGLVRRRAVAKKLGKI